MYNRTPKIASDIDGRGKKGYIQKGDNMKPEHNDSELRKAEFLRELIGGSQNSPFGVDGAVDGYRSIDTDASVWCVICAKFALPASPELGQIFLEAMLESARENLRNVNLEITGDADDMLILLLQTEREEQLTSAELRQFVRMLGILLKRGKGLDTKIGTGVVCASCSYLGFSKAEAIRTMTRYNVSKTIQSILTYISINYSDPDLTNGQIAKDNFLNYSYLCNQFKKEMGITLNHYIQEFRMKTAADLLTLPNRNVLEIAAMVGFTDVKYFSKCFKAAYGVTPNQYKLLHKKDR